MNNVFAQLIAPYARRIGNMLARGTVVMANAANKCQTLQLKLLAGETKDDIEHLEPYGFTSHPKPGAEHLTVFLDGDRGHGVTVVVADRRYRLKGMAEGEVAMYTDEGDYIWFKRDGNIEAKASTKIKATAPTMEIIASVKVLMTTPMVEASQDMKVGGKLDVTGTIVGASTIAATGNISSTGANIVDSSGKTMASIRSTYNSHGHPALNAAPTQQI